MATLNIKTKNLRDNRNALYCVFGGQITPQKSFLTLFESGNVSANWTGEIGNAMPTKVFHGRDHRINVQCVVDCAALADYLESPEFLALAERYYAGHRVEWDGNNHRGRNTDDAAAVLAIIECDLGDIPVLENWEPEDECSDNSLSM